MKLPVKVSGSSITDAERKVVVTTTAANGDYWLTDFNTDAENDAHLAEIVAALNERDALRAQVAELVAALKSARLQLEGYKFEAGGEAYNDPDLNALIAEVEGDEDDD